MAETIILNVVEGIIGRLVSFAIQEIGLLWGVQDELDMLKATVSTIRAVLLDAEAQEELNHQDKDWVQKLKDAVYDADDLLDDFEAEVISRQDVNKVLVFFSCSNQIDYGISMGHKIKAVKEKLDAFTVDRVKFSLQVPKEGRRVVIKGWRETESSVPEIVVGRDGDKDEVMKLLLASDGEKVSVVSIVGLGGLGKTTLAQMVFNEDEVKLQFSLRLWVCVSDPFDVKLVVQKILSTTGQERETLESLKTKLEEKIGKRKCLLVLDDVWNENEEEWQRLKNLVSGAVGEGSCKIIVTTRSQRVAEITSTLRPYVLKGLTIEESWSLLVQVVFRGQQPENSRVIEIGKQIVEKCLGVPLVIKIIGSVLREKNPETKWLSFLEKELSGVVENDVVVSRLKLSYDHLPLHLKHCFAYCGLFPKDHEISVETLIHLWISQGFIQSSHPNRSLEEIGHDCFMDLWRRSFFQDAKKDLFGNVTSCKMHDLMHDLATSMARPESTILLKSSGDIDGRTHHVSLGYDLESPLQFPSNLLGARSLRTLLLPSQDDFRRIREGSEEKSPKDIFSSLRHLRVVDLHNLGLKEVSSSIGNQKHLRYLDVSKNKDITVLSSSITKLQKLLVLKVVDCKRLKELPEDIEKLFSLRHLLCEGCDSLSYMPRGIGQLTSLQTLSWFIVAKDRSIFEKAGCLNELNKLNELRKLVIKNLGYRECTPISEFEAANLKEKKHLKSLVLFWNRDDGSIDTGFEERSLEILEPHSNLKQIEVHEYGGLRFPSWLSCLTSLVEIQIVDCHKCQHLPSMDQLPFLKELRISQLHELEFIDSGGNWHLTGSKTFFPSLEKLWIWNCLSLKGWWKEIYGDDRYNDLITASAGLPEFAILSLLYIRNCPQLTQLPLFKCLSQKLNFVNANLEPLQQNLKMIPLSPSVCISSLTNVVEIYLKGIGGYKHLPSFDEIPSLKDLCFNSLNDLEYVSCLKDFHLSRSGDSRFFPSLKKIWIRNCPFLKGWWKNDYNIDDATMATDMELPQFSCLSLFEVMNCPLFTSVPGLSYLDQKLSLENASMVPVKQLQVQCPKVGYSNVVEIKIFGCSGCQSIPPLDQLPSLQDLHLYDLGDLEYIDFDPRGAPFFLSLKNLFIGKCPSLIGWRTGENDDSNGATTSISGVSLPHFPCLSSLEIVYCPKLISLPLSQTLVEKLSFVKSNIKSFPSNVSSLTNLREIWLDELPNLGYVDHREVDLTIDKRAFFPFLKELRIWQCPDLKGWWKNSNNVKNLPQFPQLSVLEIRSCQNWLPSRLSSLTNLKLVQFSDMNDLEYIETERNSWLSRQATGSSTVFSCLKELYIHNCPKLKGWWRISEPNNSTNGNPPDLPHFPKLSLLEVMCCPMFTMMPLFPTLDDKLYLKDVNSEIFQQTVKMMPTSIQQGSVRLSGIYPPLSNLKELWICNVPNLEYMNCTVFPFLRKLQIYDCAILKGWWANQDEDADDITAVAETSKFPQLSLLEIKNCPMLTSMPLFPCLDDRLILENASIEPLLQTMEMKIKMKGKLKMTKKLKALVPTKFFCCSSAYAPNSHSSIVHPLCNLKRLSIEKVEDFQSLPENWLQKLTSLQVLTIKDCPRLVSVPQGIQSLASSGVEISGCPT